MEEDNTVNRKSRYKVYLERYNKVVERVNYAIADTRVGQYFRLESENNDLCRWGAFFSTEIWAGIATFFAMAYIISVNATIMKNSGGPCKCPAGLDCGTSNPPVEYQACLERIHHEYITTTALISAISSIAMGVFANLPVALAPGMGLNAYFATIVVGFHGTGSVSYEKALTAIFVEGLIFVALSIFGIRQWLTTIIPSTCKLGAGVGIGLYLALVGFTYDSGLGIITPGGGFDKDGNEKHSTLLLLAGCAQDLMVDGACPRHTVMTNGRMWLGIFFGGILPAIGLLYRSKFAIIGGILLVTFISWPRNTPFTHFPNTPDGDERFKLLGKVFAAPVLKETFNCFDWQFFDNPGDFVLTMLTFLYVDLLDCTGTLHTMARISIGLNKKDRDFEGSASAYIVDASSISLGALFGLPPMTAYIESGTGIGVGGRTGITAITTGLCFAFALPFAPISASIPPWATGGTLIVIGAMMSTAARNINWRYAGDAFPAFVTLATMPFTYSIAYGMIAGIVSYILINVPVWIVMKRWSVVPVDHGGEIWTWKVEGGLLPQWLRRAFRGQRKFWVDHEADERRSARVARARARAHINRSLNGPAAPAAAPQRDSIFAPGRFANHADVDHQFPAGHMRNGYFERYLPEADGVVPGNEPAEGVNVNEVDGNNVSGRNSLEEDPAALVMDGHQRFAPSSGQYEVEYDGDRPRSVYSDEDGSDTSGSRRNAPPSEYEDPFIWDQRVLPPLRAETPEDDRVSLPYPDPYYGGGNGEAAASGSRGYASSSDYEPPFIYDEHEYPPASRYSPEEDDYYYDDGYYPRRRAETI